MRTRPAAASLWLRLVGRAFRCNSKLASAGGWRAGGATRRHGVDAAPCQPAALARHRGLMSGRPTPLDVERGEVALRARYSPESGDGKLVLR